MAKPTKAPAKRPLLTILFICINIIVIALTAFSEFGNRDNAIKLSEAEINWYWLLPAVLFFTIAIILEISKYALMLKKTHSLPKGSSISARKISRRTVLIGRYYDNITPAAIGGQPFQIYYMNKSGVSGGFATTVPIFGMISGQIGFLLIAVLTFLFGSLTINNATLVATACFGLFFYAVWPIMAMVATFLPKTTTEIITLGVRLLAKLHLIKDKDRAIKKAESGVNEYASCVKAVLKIPGLFITTIILSVVFHLLICSLPFFILTAFGGHVDFIPCFTTTVAVAAAIYFIPTPGNAGAAEGTFYLVFSALASGYVFWAMLVWRFFSYYIYIIMGAITYFFMHLDKNGVKTDSWWPKFKAFFTQLFHVKTTASNSDKKDKS